MCLNLCNYQFKAGRYSYGSTYLKTRVTTNQKHTIDSQTPKGKELKAYYKRKTSNHKRKNKKKKWTKKKYKIKWKTRFKLAISTNLSITTLNVNGLNALIKTHRVADWIKKNKNWQYAAYKRLTSGQKTHRLKVKA